MIWAIDPHSRNPQNPALMNQLHRCLVATLLATAIFGTPRTSNAEHERHARPLDFTPYTLDPKEARVGLQTMELGLWGHPLLEKMDVGISPLTYLSFGVGLKAVSAHGKYEMYRDTTLSLAVAGGVNWIDFRGVDVPARFVVIPLSLYTGVRLTNDWFLTAGVTHTRVRLKAEGMVGSIDELGGAIGTESLQVRSAVRYRLSGRTLLSLDVRYAGYQTQFIEGNVDPDSMDGDSDGVYARVESDLIGGDRAITVGSTVHWRWKRFNLELGLEYGAYSIPFIHFIVPSRSFAPRLDFYWRF